MVDNFVLKTIKVTVIDIAMEVVYFPVWWYSRGLLKTLKFCGRNIARTWSSLALGIFLKSMFKPMYGDYTWSGRIISFFMRILILIAKMVQFILWSALTIAGLISWVGLPVFALYQIFTYGR